MSSGPMRSNARGFDSVIVDLCLYFVRILNTSVRIWIIGTHVYWIVGTRNVVASSTCMHVHVTMTSKSQSCVSGVPQAVLLMACDSELDGV
jgi:hypothetical protein